MAWVEGRCKGNDVFVEVDDALRPLVRGGRVPIRYSDRPGAKVYRAGLANVEVTGDRALELPDGPAPTRASRGSGFGKAGTRTAQQTAAAAAAAAELVAGFPDSAVVCFTDGACKGNPGPAGSGLVVRFPDGRRVERHRALGRATNNIGELTAIAMALEALDEAEVGSEVAVEILSDSRYARGVLTEGWKAKANRELILAIREALAKRPLARIHWVAGHAGVPDNERADALANLGVDESLRRASS